MSQVPDIHYSPGISASNFAAARAHCMSPGDSVPRWIPAGGFNTSQLNSSALGFWQTT